MQLHDLTRPGLRLRRGLALAAAALLGTAGAGLAATSHHAVVRRLAVGYRAPAEYAPAGAFVGSASASVLPSGRLATPAGVTLALDHEPTGFSLSADGRYAVTTGTTAGGSQIEVVDTHDMSIVSRVRADGVYFSGGVAIVNDPAAASRHLVLATEGAANAIAVYDLGENGVLTPNAVPSISLGTPNLYGAASRHFLGSVASDGRRLFVVDELDRSVVSVDLATRAILSRAATGFAPHALSLIGRRLAVANEGLGDRRPLVHDLEHASSLTLLDVDEAGRFAEKTSSIAMDPTPEGPIIGGAHPAAISGLHGGEAFVAMAGVDRIATVSTTSEAVVGGTELRLFDHGPYGTQPVALALDGVRKQLYVALSGIDAVAVVDVADSRHPHRLGLIPTGSRPVAVSLSYDRKVLYVSSLRGRGRGGMLQRINVASIKLHASTLAALGDLRRVIPATEAVTAVTPALTKAIRTVVDVRMPAATFDELFGAGRTRFDAAVMPNVHKLAASYTRLDSLYAEDGLPLEGVQTALGGEATPYTIRTSLAGPARRPNTDPNALGPDDAARFGMIFDELRLHRLDYEIAADCPGSAMPCVENLDKRIVADLAAGTRPSFIAVALPDPAGNQSRSVPVDPVAVAEDDDRALGTLVTALRQSALWGTTAIFISPWRVDGAADHVDPHRVYGIVVSPYAKRGYVDRRHRALAGVLKTEEELLEVAPLSLGELLATDLGETFTLHTIATADEGRPPLDPPSTAPAKLP